MLKYMLSPNLIIFSSLFQISGVKKIIICAYAHSECDHVPLYTTCDENLLVQVGLATEVIQLIEAQIALTKVPKHF